jgi:hypothetical protein
MTATVPKPGRAIWLSRSLWLGIITNFMLALPAVINPAVALELMGLPPASPLIWLRFSGILVILLSVSYIPAALDPHRYRVNAGIAVGCRLAGVSFFTGVSLFSAERQYWLFGLYDLSFLVPQAILLTRISGSDDNAPR